MKIQRITIDQLVYYQIYQRYINDACFYKFTVLWNHFYQNINVDLDTKVQCTILSLNHYKEMEIGNR